MAASYLRQGMDEPGVPLKGVRLDSGDRLARLTAEVQGVTTAQLRLPFAQHGRT